MSEKIVYSLEIIKKIKEDGRPSYSCEYHNQIDGSDDENGVMRLLWIEFQSLIQQDITYQNLGQKGLSDTSR